MICGSLFILGNKIGQYLPQSKNDEIIFSCPDEFRNWKITLANDVYFILRMPGLSNMGQDMDSYLIGFQVIIIYHLSRIIRPVYDL